MHSKRAIILGTAALLLVAVFATVTFAATKGKIRKIIWSASVVQATVAPGGNYTATVTFTAGASLSNLNMRISPSLKGAATVSPASFASIPSNTPTTVTITFVGPHKKGACTYNGTLTARTGDKANPDPLKLRFSIAGCGSK